MIGAMAAVASALKALLPVAESIPAHLRLEGLSVALVTGFP